MLPKIEKGNQERKDYHLRWRQQSLARVTLGLYLGFLGELLSTSTTAVAPDLYELLYKFLSRQQH